MQIPAHSVTGVVLNHTESVGLDVVLNGTGDVQECVPCLDLAKTGHQGLPGDPAEGLSLLTGITDADGDAAVAVIALEVGTGVHLEQVPFADHPFRTGNAVDNLVIDAGADACGKSVIPLEARRGPHLTNAALGQSIEIASGLSRLNALHHLAKNCGHDGAGLPHDLHFAGRFDFHPSSFLNARACGRGAGVLGGRQEVSEKVHQPEKNGGTEPDGPARPW